MEKIGIAFYRAEAGELDDKIIDLVTGGLGYSHVELMISDTVTVGAHYLAKGVKKFYYGKPLTSDHRWDVYHVPVRDVTSVFKYSLDQIGKRYDTKGVVVTALTPFRCDCKEAMWCSELVAKALKIDSKYHDIDPLAMPNDLVRYFHKLGYKKSERRSTRASDRGIKEIDRFGRIKIEG